MAQNRQGSHSLPLPTIMLLVAALTGGIFSLQSPLNTLRPPAPEPTTNPAIGHETVRARLWQDPFLATSQHDHYQNTGTAGHKAYTPQDLHAQIQTRYEEAQARSHNVLIMPVMVSGEPYAEDIERRLRSRHAVLSALNVAGYLPENSTHLGYFKAPIDSLDSSLDRIVPFEWFRKNLINLQRRPQQGLSDPDYILVIWLSDEFFSREPLIRILRLLNRLKPTNPQPAADHRPFQVKLLGPSGSTTLRAMLDEITQADIKRYLDEGGTPKNPAPNFEVYSSWSTAPLPLLMKEKFERDLNFIWPIESNARPMEIKTLFEKLKHVALMHTVHTDDVLVKELLKELRRRGVDATAEEQAPVVLISEWDTFYGRALPYTFAAYASEWSPDESSRVPQTEPQLVDNPLYGITTKPEWIHIFSYTRGIDGMIPGEAPPEAEKQSDDQKARPSKLETPTGRRQFDYMRRLVKRIKRLNTTLKQSGSKNSKKGIRAIGILGSDVYDKLLVLRALRQHFPGVLFFTTDLDARLFHKSELEWTRNLIVASSYGLQLHPDYQQDIPPFRNTYQTSLFCACLTALGVIPQDDVLNATSRMFEIGLSQPHDLTPYGNTLSGRPLHPLRSGRPTGQVVWVAIGICTMIMVLVASGCFKVKELHNYSLQRKFWLVWVALGVGCISVTVISAYLILHSNLNGADEPWLLMEGISIWPTEILRFITVFLSIYFVILGLLKINISNEQLTRDYGLESPSPHTPTSPPLSKRRLIKRSFRFLAWFFTKNLLKDLLLTRSRLVEIAKSYLPKRHQPNHDETPNDGKIDAVDLWQRYLSDGCIRNRRWPILLQLTLAIAFYWAVMAILSPPFIPYRGGFSDWSDWFVLRFSVVAMLILALFVVNATRLCKRFVKDLTEKPTHWPGSIHTQHLSYEHLGPFNIDGSKDNQEHNPIDNWRDIQFIAKRTEPISQLIVYPFVVLFIMVLSRYSYTDNWDWPLSLLIVIGAAVFCVLFYAISLRHTGELARRKVIRRLKTKLLYTLYGSSQTNTPEYLKKQAAMIEHMISEIQSLQEGAFAPLSRNPIVVAVLFPFGGMGTVVLLEYMSTMFI